MLIFRTVKAFFSIAAFCALFVFSPTFSQAQYTLNGTATQTGVNCFRLTTESDFVVGAVWANQLISLHEPFDITFLANFGSNDVDGADGITFALQPVSTNVGTPGEGLGIGGVAPSLAVEFDTFENGYDPSFDHFALVQNGNVDHFSGNTLFGPQMMAASTSNVEDGVNHNVRVVWDPTNQNLKMFFDCQLRMDYTFPFNVVNTIFNGSSFVYWGFTGATGGFSNIQSVCILDQSFINQNEEVDICQGDSVQLFYEGGVNYQWSPAQFITSASISNPFFFPPVSTIYTVQITDDCGTSWTDTAQINVISDPTVSILTDSLACENTTFNVSAQTNGNSVLWSNNTTGINSTISLSNPGYIWAEALLQGCTSRDSFFVDLDTLLSGEFAFEDTLICSSDSFIFPNSAPGLSANYNFGTISGNAFDASENPDTVWFVSENACGQLTDTALINYYPAPTLFLPSDTQVCRQFLYQIIPDTIGSSFDTYALLWNTGETTDKLEAIPYGTGYFSLSVTDECGSAIDSIFVEISDCFPPIIIPNIITPNGDGLNDLFVIEGIDDRNFELFIFNRWGQELFYTSNPTLERWNATAHGEGEVNDGTFFYVLNNLDSEESFTGYVTVLR